MTDFFLVTSLSKLVFPSECTVNEVYIRIKHYNQSYIAIGNGRSGKPIVCRYIISGLTPEDITALTLINGKNFHIITLNSDPYACATYDDGTYDTLLDISVDIIRQSVDFVRSSALYRNVIPYDK